MNKLRKRKTLRLRQSERFFRKVNMPKAGNSDSRLLLFILLRILYFYFLLLIYSSIAFAAVLPAPMARITVAAPVTASPPA